MRYPIRGQSWALLTPHVRSSPHMPSKKRTRAAVPRMHKQCSRAAVVDVGPARTYLDYLSTRERGTAMDASELGRIEAARQTRSDQRKAMTFEWEG